MSTEKPGEHYTPEQQAALENERTLSDAELVKKGAKWNLDEKGNRSRLEMTDEMAPELKEENEGAADTLGAYIRMHKQIAIPREGDQFTPPDEELERLASRHIGEVWNPDGHYNHFYFVDKDGNIATFSFGDNEIKSLPRPGNDSEAERRFEQSLQKQFFDLGFNFVKSVGPLCESVYMLMHQRRKAIEQSEKEQKKKEFNF